MSTRGTNFLHQWISNNVPETIGAAVISVLELTQKLFADAKAAGINSAEIEEGTVRVYNTNPRCHRSSRRRLAD
jgi:ABC-type transport system involved in multi-copper enzyme maturation permease subunit